MSTLKKYKMTPEELEEMKRIACMPVIPIMNIGGWSGSERQNAADEAWQRLADKYNCFWETIEPVGGEGPEYFLAEPKPVRE